MRTITVVKEPVRSKGIRELARAFSDIVVKIISIANIATPVNVFHSVLTHSLTSSHLDQACY